ncbi:MAG: class I SAM-dependent methyltransferase [Anaerolineae bacterium]
MTADTNWKRLDALHHDREADAYDSLIGREYAPYQATDTALPWARRLAASGAHLVLDIGAGTGRTAIEVAAHGPSVIAVDTSRGMLRRLLDNARGRRVPDVWPASADAERLPFADGALDGVVCQGVLHHLPDVERAVREADRVLAPGGWLCLAEPDADRSRLDRTMKRAIESARPLIDRIGGRRSPAADHERSLAPEALLEPLRELGYHVETSYLVHPPYVYRFLPPVLGATVARLLNRGDRSVRRPADIFVAVGRKPLAPADGPRARNRRRPLA